jgi:hypothetical protein
MRDFKEIGLIKVEKIFEKENNFPFFFYFSSLVEDRELKIILEGSSSLSQQNFLTVICTNKFHLQGCLH